MHFKYLFKTSEQLDISFSIEQYLGQINDVYSSFILNDFRSISKSTSSLPKSISQVIGVKYTKAKPSKLSFWNLSYKLLRLSSNVISAFDVQQEAIDIEYILQDNIQTSHDVGFKGSKFIHLLSGLTTLDIKYKANKIRQVFNGNLQNILINSLNINPQVQWRIGDFQTSYNGLWSWSWSKNNGVPNRGNILNNNLSLTYSYKTKLFVNANGTYLHMKSAKKNSNQIFVNIGLRCEVSRKIECQLQLLNILNQRKTESFFLDSGYSLYQANAVRGRNSRISILLNF